MMAAQHSLDQEARNRIVTDINSNFFVEAGAGSGKTTMLVERMVAMVEAGIEINKICAITFTKAAASEFRKRFQELLEKRSNPKSDVKNNNKRFASQLSMPTEKSRAFCREALQNIDLCFMGTIDSFCGMVLSEHPYEAGIPSDSHVISDKEMEIILKQMYVRICNGEFDESSKNGEMLSTKAKKFSIFYKNAEEVFVRGAFLFMNNRNVHFNYQSNFRSDNIDQEYAGDRELLLRTVTFLKNHQELKYETGADNVQAWEQIADIYNNISGQWSCNMPNVLYGLKTLSSIRLIPEAEDKNTTEVNQLFEQHLSRGKIAWLDINIGKQERVYNGSRKQRGVYTRLQEQCYSTTMTFLEACVPVLEKTMRDKGTLSFFDYLYYLRNMLYSDAKGEGKLISHIYKRHSHFLIDEFQDTNPLQAEIFFYLTAEKPLPQWSQCVPQKGSLFIVGDPKQSIYRFRSADVASFLKVKHLFEVTGGTILNLTRNFRSTRELCDYYNRVFTTLFPQQTQNTDNQSKFEEIPLPDALPITQHEFHGIYTYDAHTETDPAQIEQIIETLAYHPDEHTLPLGKDNAPREIRYSDIMVITYGKKSLVPIMHQLNNRGIPFKVEGKVPFGTNEALTEVYNIYATVADPDDKLALYGALTGELMDFTWKDILAFKNNSGKLALNSSQNPDNHNDSVAHSVSEKIEQLHSFSKSVKRLSPAALFSKILEDFKIYEKVETDNLEVLYYTLELLRNAEISGQMVSLKDACAFLETLRADESEEERCLSLNESKDCVRLANLHKVKGLESPIVILAAASKPRINPTIRIQHDDKNSIDKKDLNDKKSAEGYIFTLESERDAEGKAKIYCQTEAYSAENGEKNAEKKALEEEEKRLIYVAATRARNALIICKRYIITNKGRETLNSKWEKLSENNLSKFFQTVTSTTSSNRPTGNDVFAEQLYKDAEKYCALNDRSKEKPTYEVVRPSSLAVSKLDSGQEGTVETELPEQDDTKEQNDVAGQTDSIKTEERKKFAALLGTMVHKLMEFLVTTKNQIKPEELIGEIMREFITPDLEKFEKDIKADLTKVAETMRNGGYKQTNGLPQDLLQTLLHADEVYCEVPYCYKEKKKNDTDTLWNGTMDVVYCSGGKWHIVDYKTNADGTDLDERYKEQLKAYQKAFIEIERHDDVDALTYHIDV